jgi:hypothetical protein
MDHLSKNARVVLDRMEPDCSYEPQDLCSFVPGTNVERLREIMHELWVNRQVERVGYSGWRRHRSAPPHRPHPASREIEIVKPEDLFDHAKFEGFFKSGSS